MEAQGPERLKMLLWSMKDCSKSLPTKENIMLRIGSCDSNCALCGDAIESSIRYSSNILQLGESNMRAVGD